MKIESLGLRKKRRMRMNNIFNSRYEVSLRILIQLFILDGHKKSSDYISSLDYLTIYSKTFCFGEHNLHGNNPYRLGELASRLDVGKKSLKFLVSNGFCNVEIDNDGLVYSITESGRKLVEEFKTEYANAYMNLDIDTQDYFKEYSEIEILKYINDISRKERR